DKEFDRIFKALVRQALRNHEPHHLKVHALVSDVFMSNRDVSQQISGSELASKTENDNKLMDDAHQDHEPHHLKVPALVSDVFMSNRDVSQQISGSELASKTENDNRASELASKSKDGLSGITKTYENVKESVSDYLSGGNKEDLEDTILRRVKNEIAKAK
ncbi:unnamed protein product, partial [Aphanomyces euteiches]